MWRIILILSKQSLENYWKIFNVQNWRSLFICLYLSDFLWQQWCFRLYGDSNVSLMIIMVTIKMMMATMKCGNLCCFCQECNEFLPQPFPEAIISNPNCPRDEINILFPLFYICFQVHDLNAQKMCFGTFVQIVPTDEVPFDIWIIKFSSFSDMSFFCFGIWKVYYSRYDTFSKPILCQRSKGGKVTFGKCPTWGIRVMVHSTFQRWKYGCKIAKIHFSNHCKLCGLLHFFLEFCKINCHIHSLSSSWNRAS